MSYVKQNFASGQTLTADQLNHIENGIAAIENEPKSIVQVYSCLRPLVLLTMTAGWRLIPCCGR